MIRIFIFFIFALCKYSCYAVCDSINIIKYENSYSLCNSNTKVSTKILKVKNLSTVNIILYFSDTHLNDEYLQFRDVFLNKCKGIKLMNIMYNTDDPNCCKNIIFYSFFKRLKPFEEFEIEIELDSIDFNEDNFIKNNISFFKESYILEKIGTKYESYLYPYNHVNIRSSLINNYIKNY